MSNQVTVVRVHNPFCPSKDRQVEQLDTGFSIQDWINDHTEVLSYPVICIVNGEPILRDRWSTLFSSDGDIIVFLRIPEGGGGGGGEGGGGGKNPLLATIGLALMVVGTIFTSGILSAVIVGAGTILTVMGAGLLGIPAIPSTDQANQLAAPSPTYTLSAQGNTARIGKPIPVIYGNHLIYPDFAAQPYYEFIDNKQFLYHIMVIGQGEYDLDKVRIEDSSIDGFSEITWEKIEPAGAITLFDHNVVTSLEVSGQQLKGANLGGDWIGPFIVNPSNTTANKIAIDVSLDGGLYEINAGILENESISFRIEARKVDNQGAPTGSWITLSSETITDNTRTAIRKTYKYTLATPGRYEVRVKRTSDESSQNQIVDTIKWIGAKAYLSDVIDYGNITMLAVKMLATDNLSGTSSRKVNCIVTRKLPVWHPTSGWSSTSTGTSSMVWAITDMLKSSYGGKITDDKIDLVGLYNLDAILSSRGDYFNAVFDRKMTLWEALKLACRVGRSAGILQGGVFRIIRDRAQTIPVAMFSTRNTIKGSFVVKYDMASEDTVDGVTVEFLNKETWRPDEVSSDDQGNAPTNPAKIKIFGCTNKAHALREAKYLARNNSYRRTIIQLSTELEGYIPTFGDLVTVSHDMPNWGLSGDVIGVGNDGTITVSEKIEFKTGLTYNIAFRTKTGSIYGPFEVETGGNIHKIILTGIWTSTHSPDGDFTTMTDSDGNIIRLYYGTQEERTQFSFGVTDKWCKYGVIKSISPKGESKVELTILAEDSRVHTD
jgi:sulfur carrier protein ThiS